MTQKDETLALRARQNFRVFNEEIKGIHFPEYKYEQFYDWIKSGRQHGCFMESRGSGKSLFFSQCFVEWQILRNKNFKVGVVSSSLPQTLRFLQNIKDDFEQTPLLQDYVPHDKDTPWSKQTMHFANGSKLYALTFGPGARGIHLNMLICDDLLRDLETSVDNAKETFWSILYPTVQTLSGSVILVGTPMMDNDLFFEIQDKLENESGFDKRWFLSVKPAVKIDNLGNWLEPLWKERFTLDALRGIQRDIGVSRFSREYLLEPTSFESSFFRKDAIINSLSTAYGFKYNSLTNSLCHIGADFALSTASRADYSAFVVANMVQGNVEVDYGDRKEVIDSPIFIRYIFHARGVSEDNQLFTLRRMYSDYSSSQAIIDKTNFGLSFYNKLYGELNVEGQDFPMAKRNALLTNLKSLLESGRLVLPYKEDELNCKSIIEELVQQLKGFVLEPDSASIKSKARHDDLVIGLALAVKNMGNIKKSMVSNIIITSDMLSKDKELVKNSTDIFCFGRK